MLHPRKLLAIVAWVLLLAGPQTLAWSAPSWVDQRQVGPFVCRAAFDLSPYEQVLSELPALELELRRVLALRPCKQPIDVLLLANEKQHRQYLAERFPGTPYRRALFVKHHGRSTVFAYRHEELAIDLRHECTHALLHADLPMIPLWLDEGLAEYFEMPANKRAFDNPHAGALKLRMQLGLVRGLTTLETRAELSDLSLKDYQYAWAWTHLLLHGPRAATEQLWEYLAAIRRREPPGVMSERLELALSGANAGLVRHFRSWHSLKQEYLRANRVAMKMKTALAAKTARAE